MTNKYLFFIALFLLEVSVSNSQSCQWAVNFGRSVNTGNAGYSITTDPWGNVFTTGWFDDTTDFDPGAGTYYLYPQASLNVFVSKLDSGGHFIWAKNFKGTNSTVAYSNATDALGNIYTTGRFRDTIDFDPGLSVYNLISVASTNDCFISKLDSSGDFKWAFKFGDVEEDEGLSTAVDGAGNIYTMGFFADTVDFDPGPGVFELIGDVAMGNLFISKINSGGNFIWAKKIAGPESFKGTLTIGPDNKIYLTGSFGGTVDFDPNAGVYNLTSTGGDAFVCKFDTAFNLIWAKNFGGLNSACFGHDVAVDGSGNVICTGVLTDTVDFDPGAGVYNLIPNYSPNSFVAKLDSVGNFVWAKSLNGVAGLETNSIAIDGGGSIYTTGYFSDTADFDPGAGSYNLISAGSNDMFLSKLFSTGDFAWAKRIGGTDAYDIGESLSSDHDGNIYTTGTFSDTVSFDVSGGFNLISQGYYNTFVAKFNGCNRTYASMIQSSCGSFTSPSGLYTWTSSGIFTDTIPNSSGCDSVITVDLTIVTADVTVTQTGDTLSANAIGASFQWLNCDSGYAVINGANGQVLIPTSNGNYAVQVNQSGCIDTSICYNIIGLSVLENSFGGGIGFYPNPVKSNLEINLGQQFPIVEIEISDVTGKVISKKLYTNTSKINTMLGEESGVYFVRISSGNKTAVFKLVKQ